MQEARVQSPVAARTIVVETDQARSVLVFGNNKGGQRVGAAKTFGALPGRGRGGSRWENHGKRYDHDDRAAKGGVKAVERHNDGIRCDVWVVINCKPGEWGNQPNLAIFVVIF